MSSGNHQENANRPEQQLGSHIGLRALRQLSQFSVRSLLLVVLLVGIFLAGRQSREFYPSLWFLGRGQPVVRQSAYVETGSILYAKTNLPVRRVAVRDQTICDAAPDSPTQLRLLAKRPGTTTVLYWQQGREEPLELTVVVAATR